MQVLKFGEHLLLHAIFLCGILIVLPLLGVLFKDRRFVVSARAGFYTLFLLLAGSAGCLLYGFVSGQYGNEYIFRYSERSLAIPFKLAGLWAGLQGSLLFWSLILSAYSAVAALQHRWSSRDPVGRRLEPYVYMVLATVCFFFILITYQTANPFHEMTLNRRLEISPDGIVRDGFGLNPQLENYWMAIHPPCLYVGLVGFTIPFALAMAALLAGEMGDYWIKIVRRWTLVAWTILTVGIILGGLWAYEMLGWGGYWAWDPVENASILPWFVGTAFLHSVMVQERRDMLKGWNVFLIMLTFFMTIIATYMTRSGVVESVHAFSEGDVGKWFMPFMLTIVFGGALLIGWRAPLLRGKHKLVSYLSREAAFFFNNLVLLALMGTVYLLSMFGKISHDFFKQKLTAREVVYNMVTTPLFLLLLLLTALGPQLGWVKTSARLLFKRILWPASVAAVAALAALPYWMSQDTIELPALGPLLSAWRETGERPQELVKYVEKYHYYSTLAGLGLAAFIITSVGAEVFRGIRARVRFRHEKPIEGALNLVLGNNRRYGGYIVHIGIAVIAIGVIWSSNFRIRKELTIHRNEPTEIGNSGMQVTWSDQKMLPSGNPYQGEAYRFDLSRAGRDVASLWSEVRYYPKQREAQVIAIPAIQRRPMVDYYVHTSSFADPQKKTVSFTIFINPLINWIWTGAVIMLLGGIFAALPMPNRRVGVVD